MCKNLIIGVKSGIVQVKFVIGQQVSSSLLKLVFWMPTFETCKVWEFHSNIWDIFIMCRILMSGDIDPGQQWWNEKQLMMCVSSCGFMSAWWNLLQNCPSGVSVFGASFTATALCWRFEFLRLSPINSPRFEHHSLGDFMWTYDKLDLLVMFKLNSGP